MGCIDGCFFPISEVASRRVEVRSGVVNGPELLRSDFHILTDSVEKVGSSFVVNAICFEDELAR
ncbi:MULTISPECIES: hypothetical protein, partial [unclassified Bradyrhizobium]|uniref:hypothetical protein n=1 Tax=unclassified Bradyrhizobium TaxID=2631580 RepID=UPI002916675C